MKISECIEIEMNKIGASRDDESVNWSETELAIMNRQIHFLKTIHLYLNNPNVIVKEFTNSGIKIKTNNQ